MIRTFVTAAAMIAPLSLVGAAQAQVVVPKNQEFAATPMQKGAPENLPGENLIPGMSLAMQTVNAVTQPVLQPILAPDAGAAPAAQPGPGKRMMKKSMSKKMMKKKGM